MIENDVSWQEDVAREKRVALSYVEQAFAEAELDGLASEAVIQAALFESFRHLVAAYGEEETATYAATFPERIRRGAFSVGRRH